MISLVNYDVYIDGLDGWEFSTRFDENRKQDAYSLAQKYQNANKSVKIIRESFDVEDNIYTEKLEYLSGIRTKKKKIVNSSSGYIVKKIVQDINSSQKKKNSLNIKDSIVKALFRLVFIVVFSLIITHLCVAIAFPIFEKFLDYKDIKTAVFLTYFLLFLFISIPLLLKKVPWEVFLSYENISEDIDEKDFYAKATYVNSLYNINMATDIPSAPVARNISIEYKEEVISFLDMVLNSLEDISIKDDFSKLGIKFVIFGGVMDFAKYSGLSLAYANALLFEAFSVIDGKAVNLESFYEIKSAYKDSDIAIFMTGIGASWMTAKLLKKPFRHSLLNTTLKRWKKQKDKEKDIYDILSNANTVSEGSFKVVVGINTSIKYDDTGEDDNQEDFYEHKVSLVKERVESILQNFAKKYCGEIKKRSDEYFEIHFMRISSSIKFSIDLFENIINYQNSVNLPIKCTESFIILPYYDENISIILPEILKYSYDSEIVIFDEIYEKIKNNYKFIYLGDKNISSSLKSKGLYKLHF